MERLVYFSFLDGCEPRINAAHIQKESGSRGSVVSCVFSANLLQDSLNLGQKVVAEGSSKGICNRKVVAEPEISGAG